MEVVFGQLPSGSLIFIDPEWVFFHIQKEKRGGW